MRLFITGATGFIGSHVVRLALAQGHEVVALRRPGSAARIPLPTAPAWVDGDLTSLIHDDGAALEGCDALIHLAAAGVNPTSQLASSWSTLFKANVNDSLGAWRCSVGRGVRRIVVCGSCFEYGTSGERYDFIPPTAPLEPTHAYAASKAAATMAALGLARAERVECAIVRPFHVFGEGEDDARFWPSLARAARNGIDFPMTAGEQVRDFIPVENVAASLLSMAVDRPLVAGEPEVHNLGSGVPTTIREFATSWWSHWKARGRLLPGALPYRPGEVMRYVPELTL